MGYRSRSHGAPGWLSAGFSAGQQARIERRKETTMVFDSVFEALSKAENIQQVEGVVIQNLSVRDIECYGNIEIVQDSSINMNIIQTFTEEQATTLANNIAVDLEAKAEQASKQKADGKFHPNRPNNSTPQSPTLPIRLDNKSPQSS